MLPSLEPPRRQVTAFPGQALASDDDGQLPAVTNTAAELAADRIDWIVDIGSLSDVSTHSWA